MDKVSMEEELSESQHDLTVENVFSNYRWPSDEPKFHVEKYFISLSLPERLRVWLARTKDNVLKRLGGLVGRPMNPNKYHITLAVLLLPPKMSQDLWDKITIDLVDGVQQELYEMAGILYTTRVGKFDDGAVFLELFDHDGFLESLRDRVIEFCKKIGIEVVETACFHITMFRENKIDKLPRDLDEEYNSTPVSFGIGANRWKSNCGCRRLAPVVSELYHGRVKGYDRIAASHLPEGQTPGKEKHQIKRCRDPRCS